MMIRRFWNWLRRRRADEDLSAEIESHRVMLQEALERRGAEPADAEAASRRALGNVTLAREDARDVWIWSWLESAWQDVRVGVRGLRRNPGFALVAVLTLALGIGVNTAMFSVLEAVLFRPLPYNAPDRLAMLWTNDEKHGVADHPTSYLTFADWRTESRLFEDMASFKGEPAIVLGPNGTERVLAEAVSASLFPLLGASPLAGRTFTVDEDERGEAVVVLSYGLWMRQFGGSASAIDTFLTLGGFAERRYRIVGVMPREFYFPNKDVQLWRTSFDARGRSGPPKSRTESRFRFIVNDLGVIGRLRPGVTAEQAQAEMTTIGGGLAARYPTTDQGFPGFGVRVVPLLDQVTGTSLQQALWMLFGAVSVVLLIACVNVTNLLLVRSAARAHEFAIRAALGASRARLARQSLTETAALTVAAAVVGVLLASAGVRALASVAPAGVYPQASASYVLTDSVPVPVGSAQAGIPRLDEIGLDVRILLFTIAVSALAAVFLGLVPARRAVQSDPHTALGQGGRAAVGSRSLSRTRQALVAIECGLAVVLLVGAGLLIKSVARLAQVDPGFSSGGVLLLRVSIAPSGSSSPLESTDGFALFYEQVRVRLASLPGVESVGQITDFFARADVSDRITIPGRAPETTGELGWGAVDPGFFSTVRAPLIAGRFFSSADARTTVRVLRMSAEELKRTQAATPVVVNEIFARKLFPGEDATGKRFGLGSDARMSWFEVVGVVGNMRRAGLDQPPLAEYFTPYIGQTSELAIRTTGDPEQIARTAREVIRSIEQRAIVMSATSLDRKLAELDAHRRLQAWLLMLFASLALVLSAVGIYAVVRYSVAQRVQELGVRIALGATPMDIARLVIGQGLVAPFVGLTLGLLAALGLTRVLAHALFETSRTDPLTLFSVVAALTLVALIACLIPARRASRVDPVVALRQT